MNLLLDTHAFLWWTSEPERLPLSLVGLLRSPDNKLFLSAAVSWEVAIKTGIGKLTLKQPWESIVQKEIEQNGTRVLPITLDHTFTLRKLAPLHKDPFDRMLLAQAMAENLILVTDDSLVRRYPDVKTKWD